MLPGQYILQEEDIVCNENSEISTISVVNIGDRPIQVGSHFHFYEVNKALQFNREDAYGKRLDIPAGAAIRFEPGDEKEIQLIRFAGERRVYGFSNIVDGPLESGDES